MKSIGAASGEVAGHISDDSARDDFIESAAAVVKSLTNFLQQTKALYNEPNNQDFKDAFSTANRLLLFIFWKLFF